MNALALHLMLDATAFDSCANIRHRMAHKHEISRTIKACKNKIKGNKGGRYSSSYKCIYIYIRERKTGWFYVNPLKTYMRPKEKKRPKTKSKKKLVTKNRRDYLLDDIDGGAIPAA